jgi:hypothetical protein
MAPADPASSSLQNASLSNRPLWPPTRPSLRRFLLAVLPSDADLDAFVSDHFTEVYRRFSAGMDRLQKYTLLLDHKPRHIILAALREHDGQQYQLSEHLLDFGIASAEVDATGEGELRRAPRRSRPPAATKRRLPPPLEVGLWGEAGDGSDGIAAEFVDALLGTFGRRASAPFRPPRLFAALRRSAVAALDEVIPRPAAQLDSEDLLTRLRDWLLSRAVVGNLAPLLSPSEQTELDVALLHEEFTAAALRPEELGHESADAAVCGFARGLLRGLCRESALHELIAVAEVRRVLVAAGVDVEAAAPAQGQSELVHLQNLAQRIAAGEAMPDELMQALGQLLASLAVQPDRLRQQIAYQVAEQALSRAGLSQLEPPSDAPAALPDATQRQLDGLHAQLEALRKRLLETSATESPAELLELERAYRQQLREQFGRLTFKGITPSGTALGLPLKEVYVDLKAVSEVPELADTYSADERRLLSATAREGGSMSELTMHLDSLRLLRWRQEGRRLLERAEGRPGESESRRERSRVRPRSVAQLLTETDKPGIVILGDPGSGKTTLLHYLALCAAEDELQKGAPKALPDLPIFVPLAAYDDHLRHSGASLSLEEFLPIYYEKWRGLPGLAPLFRQALRGGRALLLLDGLDEVLDVGTRQYVAEQTGALLHRFAGSGNRFVVTSRVVGYREAPLSGELLHVTVLDFGKEEIERFAARWCEAFGLGQRQPQPLGAAPGSDGDAGLAVRSQAHAERRPFGRQPAAFDDAGAAAAAGRRAAGSPHRALRALRAHAARSARDDAQPRCPAADPRAVRRPHGAALFD